MSTIGCTTTSLSFVIQWHCSIFICCVNKLHTLVFTDCFYCHPCPVDFHQFPCQQLSEKQHYTSLQEGVDVYKYKWVIQEGK